MFTKQSKWIGCGKEFSAPFVIKKFTAKQGEKASIDICGLGYYELFVNGIRVGEEFFKPAASDYSERDFTSYAYPLPDKTSHTIYYNTYDISTYLKDGENVLAVLLGNGFYRQMRRTCEGNTWFNEELILRFELTLGDRKICTDGTEKVAESFIKENNLFYGEENTFTGNVSAVTLDTLSGYQFSMAGNVPAGVTITDFSLSLKSTTSLKVYFTATSLSGVVCKVGDTVVTPMATGAVNEYCIVIENITAKDLDTNYVVNIGGCELTLNTLSYAFRALEYSSNADLNAAMQALYLYNQAANEYFETGV